MKKLLRVLTMSILAISLPISASAVTAVLPFGSTSVDTTSSSFTIPAINSTVSVSTHIFNTISANIPIEIADGTHDISGYLTSSIVNANSFTYQVSSITSGSPGNTMASGALITYLGIPLATTIGTTNQVNVSTSVGNVSTISLPSNPVISGLSASQCVGTNASSALTSNTNCVQSVASGGGGITIGGTAANPTIADSVTMTAPTVQRFMSGSGTYTTPAGVIWLRVFVVGGGGGAAGVGTGAGAGGNGASSTFGTSLITAGGGVGVTGPNAAYGGNGGTATVAAGPLVLYAVTGGHGEGSATNFGGGGGNSCLGGNGGGAGGGVNGSGGAGTTNSGSGGGGGYDSAIPNSSSGGGSGACIVALIDAPSATYAYTVGAGGTAGTAGTGGNVGGGGGSGIVTIEEHYNY
jgi:hypothetical protein